MKKFKLNKENCNISFYVSNLPNNSILKYRSKSWVEWDFFGNKYLSLFEITKGSEKIACWKCNKCNSKYKQIIKDHLRNMHCPYCSGKRVNYTNSLRNLYPSLLCRWNFEKNINLTPDDVTACTSKKVWWIGECGHEWVCAIRDITLNNLGCPYCSGHRACIDNCLATLNPELASEWNPTKNGELTANDVTCGSKKKVWWLGKCGHEWNTSVYHRNKGTDCPYCAISPSVLIGYNDLWTVAPEISGLLENKEDGYKYTRMSDAELNWKCVSCESVIRKRKVCTIKNTNLFCSSCSDKVSYPEKVMIQILDFLNIKYIHDKSFKWSNAKRYDFYLPLYNTIIEVHGLQHYESGFVIEGSRSLEEEKVNDIYKYNLANRNDIDNYFVIDCRKSYFNYIKTSIINSGLLNLLGYPNIDWDMIRSLPLSNKKVKTIKMYKSGVEISKIASTLLIEERKVNKYLIDSGTIEKTH